MMQLAPFIILCIVTVFGTLGNVFIIGAVCLDRKLRVRGNIFVVNLAVVDLIITSYIMPIGLATSQYKVNPFSDTMCKINAFLILLTCGVSTQTLMMIALERYLHICKTHWYKRIFTPKIISALVAFTWVYSAAWTCQGWTGWTEFIYGEDVYLCILDGTVSLSYNMCLTVFGMLLPMMVLSFCYFKIFCTVRSSKSNIRSDKHIAQEHPEDPVLLAVYRQKKKKLQREQRLIWTLFTIVILFIVFWTPASIVLPMSGLWADMPKILYTISVWTSLSNSSVNSVVYGAMNKNFRNGYLALFKRIFCCFFKRQKCDCHIHASTSRDDSASTSTSRLPSPETSVTQDPLGPRNSRSDQCSPNQKTDYSTENVYRSSVKKKNNHNPQENSSDLYDPTQNNCSKGSDRQSHRTNGETSKSERKSSRRSESREPRKSDRVSSRRSERELSSSKATGKRPKKESAKKNKGTVPKVSLEMVETSMFDDRPCSFEANPDTANIIQSDSDSSEPIVYSEVVFVSKM